MEINNHLLPAGRDEAPLHPIPGHPAPTVSPQILQPDKDAQVSYTGLVFSTSGDRLYLASVNGSIKVFTVDSTDSLTALDSFLLPPATAPQRKVEIPAGLALSRDGKRLYVVLNLSNRLAELDAQSGRVLRSWDVGVVPYDVVLAGPELVTSTYHNWKSRTQKGYEDVIGFCRSVKIEQIAACDYSLVAARHVGINIDPPDPDYTRGQLNEALQSSQLYAPNKPSRSGETTQT